MTTDSVRVSTWGIAQVLLSVLLLPILLNLSIKVDRNLLTQWILFCFPHDICKHGSRRFSVWLVDDCKCFSFWCKNQARMSQASVFFHFCSSGGKNTLLITTDNSLNTGVSEIQEFTAGSLTVWVPSSGPYFPAAIGTRGLTDYRKGSGYESPPSFVQVPLSLAESQCKREDLWTRCFQMVRKLSSLKKKRGEDGCVRSFKSTFSRSGFLFWADIRYSYLKCCLAYPKHISVMITMIFNVLSSSGAEDACWSWIIKQCCHDGPHCVLWGFV